jgi:hypothetical protein
MESKFTISEVLSDAWAALKSQIWILVGLLIGYVILYSVLGMLLSPAMEGSVALAIIINLVLCAVTLVFSLGYLKNLFQALDGEEPQFSAYGQQANKIGIYFVAAVIYAILVYIVVLLFIGIMFVTGSMSIILISIGTLLFIIPGIYIALRLQFYVAFIVEEDADIIESLQKSWAITKDQVLPLLLLALAMIGIIIVGIICFGVGVFVAGPLIILMQCCVFRKLNSPLNVIEEE